MKMWKLSGPNKLKRPPRLHFKLSKKTKLPWKRVTMRIRRRMSEDVGKRRRGRGSWRGLVLSKQAHWRLVDQ